MVKQSPNTIKEKEREGKGKQGKGEGGNRVIGVKEGENKGGMEGGKRGGGKERRQAVLKRFNVVYVTENLGNKILALPIMNHATLSKPCNLSVLGYFHVAWRSTF